MSFFITSNIKNCMNVFYSFNYKNFLFVVLITISIYIIMGGFK